MSSIRISRNSLLANMPPVHTRSITLDVGKITVECNIKKYVKSNIPEEVLKEIRESLTGLKIRAMLSFEPYETENIMGYINSRHATRRIVGIEQPVIEKRFSALPPKLDSIDLLTKTIDSKGRPYYDIPFSFTFEDSRITEENPRHMACLVFAYSQPETDSAAELDSYLIMGKINTDIIIDNSRLVMETYGLQTPSGYMWLGDTHRGRGGLMSGRTRTRRSTKLTEVKVPNTKIRDYRIFQKTNTSQLIKEPNKASNLNVAQFSNPFISADQHKNVRGLFGIDCRQIYLNNVKFTNFIQDSDIFTKLMPYMRIKSIKIFRVRSGKGVFSKHLIAHTSDNNSLRERSLIPETLKREEEVVGSINEVYLDHNTIRGNATNHIRYISFVDNEISGFTGGRYYYEAEIEFEDGTEAYFRRAHRRLKNSLKNIEMYVQSISPLSINQHGHFEQEFTTFNIRNKERVIGGCIAAYIENLSLTNTISGHRKKELERTLINMAHPMCGDMNSLSFFQGLIQKQISENDSLLTKTNPLANTRDGKKNYGSSLSHVNTDRNSFLVIKEYSRKEETHTIDCFNNTGFAYLYEPTTELSSVGVANISITDWQQRVTQESQKYPGFDVSSNISGLESNFYFNSEKNKNSYLSPIYGRAGNNVVNLNERNEQSVFAGFNALMYSRSQVKKISDIDVSSYDKVIDNEEQALKQIEGYSNTKSIVVLSSAETIAVMGSKKTLVEENEDQTAKNYVGGTKLFDDTEKDREKFINETVSKRSTRKRETIAAAAVLSQILPKLSSNNNQTDNQSRTLSQEKGPIETSNEKLNIKNVNNLVDSLPAGKLGTIPNQIMSAVTTIPNAFKSVDSHEFIRDYTNDSEFNIKFNSLQEIEILTGYGAGITDMRWKTLNEDSLKAIKGATLARMIPYKNADLGIEEKLKCPAYNRYFILGDPQLLVSSTNFMTSTTLGLARASHPPEFYSSSSLLKKGVKRNGLHTYMRAPITPRRGRNNLYTSGGEYMLPDGREYIGDYHIHPTGGAMVGKTHTSQPHATLTPMRAQSRRPAISRPSRPSRRETRAERSRRMTGLFGGGSAGGGSAGGGSAGY